MTATMRLWLEDGEQPEMPLARAIYAYALMLALLFGDDTGAEPLVERVRGAKQWDEGWTYWGMGQSGDSLSPLDKAIIALGMAGVREAMPAILEMMALLDADSGFSHHRAVAIALERLGDPAAAPALAELLGKPGMSGHVHDTLDAAKVHNAAHSRTHTANCCWQRNFKDNWSRNP